MFLFCLFLLSTFTPNAHSVHEYSDLIESINHFGLQILAPFDKICGHSVKIIDDVPSVVDPNNFGSPKFRLCQTIVSLGDLFDKVNFQFNVQNWLPGGIFRRIVGKKVEDDGGNIQSKISKIRVRVIKDLEHLTNRFWWLLNDPEKVDILRDSAIKARDSGLKNVKMGQYLKKRRENVDKHLRQKVAQLEALKADGNASEGEKVEVAYEMLFSGDLVMREFQNNTGELLKWGLQQFGANLVAYDVLDGELVEGKGVLGKWPIGMESEGN